MGELIIAGEYIVTILAAIATITHLIAWRLAVRDQDRAEGYGIRNGSLILFAQNVRTERARWHMKATVFLLGIYTLWRPNPPDTAESAQRWYTLILVSFAIAIAHPMVCSILDLFDRRRIRRQYKSRRELALATGVWDGRERRSDGE